MPETTYEQVDVAETPLERAARAEAEQDPDRQDEREADRLIADIDSHVAQTDPASLPEAEQELNAWEIPASPLDGVPGDVALHPGEETDPLVSVCAAQSEMEANIVRGLLEGEGIPVVFDGLPTAIMGNVFQAGETCWGDVLVPASHAEQARALLSNAAPASPGDTTTTEAE